MMGASSQLAIEKLTRCQPLCIDRPTHVLVTLNTCNLQYLSSYIFLMNLYSQFKFDSVFQHLYLADNLVYLLVNVLSDSVQLYSTCPLNKK